MTAIPNRGGMTKAWLDERFGAADGAGWSAIETSASGEQTFSRTGGPVCLCWGSAAEVVAHVGGDRAVQTGYFCRQGSTSLIAGHAEGHDLALVDGRYLVDGWLAHVVGAGPCVLDLEDPADLAKACVIHEPFVTWTIEPDIIQYGEAA